MKHNYFKSEQFGDRLRKEENKNNGESISNLLVKLKQAIEYYIHTNTFPKFIEEKLIDSAIHMLIDFRNKLFSHSMIIPLEWRDEEEFNYDGVEYDHVETVNETVL